jgi:hypothetical protein
MSHPRNSEAIVESMYNVSTTQSERNDVEPWNPDFFWGILDLILAGHPNHPLNGDRHCVIKLKHQGWIYVCPEQGVFDQMWKVRPLKSSQGEGITMQNQGSRIGPMVLRPTRTRAGFFVAGKSWKSNSIKASNKAVQQTCLLNDLYLIKKKHNVNRDISAASSQVGSDLNPVHKDIHSPTPARANTGVSWCFFKFRNNPVNSTIKLLTVLSSMFFMGFQLGFLGETPRIHKIYVHFNPSWCHGMTLWVQDCHRREAPEAFFRCRTQWRIFFFGDVNSDFEESFWET